MKKLESLANACIIVFVLVFCGIAAHIWRLSPPSSGNVGASRPSHLGQVVDLPRLRFDRSAQTLVIAAATTCHFCIASAPFYQHLTALRAHNEIGTPVVLAFPQSEADGKAFADHFSIHPDTILSTSLASLGVEGTPTLLLVNKKGEVIKEWVGELPAVVQQQVIKTL